MKFFIITGLSILFSFVLISTPAIAEEPDCVPCDELAPVEECMQKVDFFDYYGCALDEACLGHCVAFSMVKTTKKCIDDNEHPVCEKLKAKWVDQCQYDIDGYKCPKPCCQ